MSTAFTMKMVVPEQEGISTLSKLLKRDDGDDCDGVCGSEYGI